MSEKKLYYQLSDNADVSQIVMELSGCMTWIEEDMKELTQEESDDEQREYTLVPIWLTDEEYENLPEANL